MSRLLLPFFIFTIGCQTKTIDSELRPLLVDHLNNEQSYNLAIEQPNGKMILQFVQESTEVQHISIVLDPQINDLKEHSKKIESLLTKCGFEYYYGSSNNFMYADFSNDQIDQVISFTELFFEKNFITHEPMILITQWDYLMKKVKGILLNRKTCYNIC